MKVKIYDTDIELKTHYCSLNNIKPSKIDKQYVNLYIRFKGCNARCSFCEYYNDALDFNIEKFKEVLSHVISKIDIRKLNFTGGEPTMDFDKFKEIYDITMDIIGDKVSEITINTNGINLDKLLLNTNKYDTISLSRHHYDDNKNDEIFKTTIITSKEIKRLNNRKTLNLTCNLSKGYIDNKDDIYKYLEHADDIGVNTVGFVTLMPINDYCVENYIDFTKMIKNDDRITMTKEWKNENTCICHNFLYIADSGNVINVYHKNTYDPDNGYPMLVFDGGDLLDGFNGKKIK